jgi:hypothetical protein
MSGCLSRNPSANSRSPLRTGRRSRRRGHHYLAAAAQETAQEAPAAGGDVAPHEPHRRDIQLQLAEELCDGEPAQGQEVRPVAHRAKQARQRDLYQERGRGSGAVDEHGLQRAARNAPAHALP